MNLAAKSSETTTRSLVGFEIGEVPYAVDIQSVREIIRPMPTLPLPHVPPVVVGVVDHRGDVVPILDLRTRFGLESRSGREVRWIIVSRNKRLSGLVVDRVTEVFSALESDSRQVPSISTGEDTRGITAAYSHRGRLVFVLDINRLTAIADVLDLDGIELPTDGGAVHG